MGICIKEFGQKASLLPHSFIAKKKCQIRPYARFDCGNGMSLHFYEIKMSLFIPLTSGNTTAKFHRFLREG
jgi:hypothetical protein